MPVLPDDLEPSPGGGLDRGVAVHQGCELHLEPLLFNGSIGVGVLPPIELVLTGDVREGTTGVAALRLGRRFLGWEMNAEYAEIARRRLLAAREQLELDV